MSTERPRLRNDAKTAGPNVANGGTESLYRYIMDSVTEYAIFAVSTTGRILSWNAGATRHFGYAGDEIIGRQYDVVFTEEDRAEGAPATELASAAADGRTDNDRWHVRKDGSHFWGTNTVQPSRDGAGVLTAFIKIVRDTTQQNKAAVRLRQSEQRLRLLVESVTDHAIFAMSPSGAITLWNSGAERVFGYTVDESVGKDYSRLFTAGDVALGVPQAYLDEALAQGSSADERWLVRSSGDRFYAGIKLTLTKDDSSDDRHGFVTVIQDITARKKMDDDQREAAAEIARARDEALQAAVLKSRFLATMSHEIRTPISAVIGMTELLTLTPLSDDQRECTRIVHEAGQSLLRVINDILDYSKIEAGKLALEHVEFDLESQIDAVTDLMQMQLKHKDIALSLRLDPLLPRKVAGDPGRLRQVLTNLVGNAVKFTPRNGKIQIEASALSRGDSRVEVRFEVRDSGIGISHEVQRQLFQPFTQGDGSTERKFGGTGLGLSISKQLVTLMGGTIGVESVPSHGALFWFSLSFDEAVGTAHGASDRALEAERRTNAAHHAKILLVEDNDVNRLLAQRQFTKLGFALTSVTNGREAVEAVRGNDYDLVFMDCHMPEMDGFEATKKIRLLESTATKHLPIVAMTADAQVEDRNVCIAAGMDDYLSKPCSLAGIQNVLDRWLPARN